ncbi:MAG: uracil-DNA glycosylase [Xanthomonadales bacterium]|uniref:uracil-DNA glycosylase n=1 Tax=Dokdonella sp. TaxID=2291710 RepID=UPI002C30079F|nr:uracil-DNA glycosylase [Xanthomonadales bacterium]HQV72004.1 uracil-DNA glycosylase [Dokdonella sp.]MBK7012468.1 uracil-DNA glycosylase [Xanthomonadales bacterium]MBK7210734.1 uracil-DNA glycosylase [Xanthomonadales bacterium]MBL0223063.1 uracil-DNA glycosylase [Xanthomonadales bacterium]
MSGERLQLETSWKERLGDVFAMPELQQLAAFLRAEKAAGKVIYPPGSQIFAALDSTPFDRVKVVILGQDPYHGPGQAHGLCFSVAPGVAVPPSLQNIFKEIARDLDLPRPTHGCLTSWAKQGVLLLNTVLTVERGLAGSHQGKGWEILTDACIETLNREREGLVFLLWGSHAQAKGRLIDSQRHLILKAPHPSPLSAHRGFLGCGHFSRVNRYLEQSGRSPIDWSLPALVDAGTT